MERSGTSAEASTQVLISGAGPTGLLLAVELRRRAVDCLLIDELGAPRGWDRATVIHPRSLEIFEALGLVPQFLDQGARMRVAKFHSDGELLGELDLELAPSPYGFDLQLSEEATERLLTGSLESVGGSVTRSTGLVGLVQDPAGVTARLERDGAPFAVEAEWLVGCDGLHSVVREQSGIEFPGRDIEGLWAVFDAGIAGWDRGFDVGSVFLDTPPLILMPLPGRRWRAYLRPRSDESDLVAEASEVLRRYVPDGGFTDIENPARFRCHSRVATRYRSGRVLLAGDAAHVCSPAEGHGMNTGLQDAFNLGWKLALVCRGEASAGLLDTYEAERRPVAERVASSGADVERGQAMTAAEDRAARDAQIRAMLNDPQSAHYEAAAHAELDRCYADSGAVLGDANATFGPGDRLPDGLGVDGGDLHPLTHRAGHTLLVVGGADTPLAEVARLVEALEEAHAGSGVVDAVVGLSPRAANANLRRIDDDAVDRLGVHDTVILAVRPDRYLGFRHDGADAVALQPYLEALAARQ